MSYHSKNKIISTTSLMMLVMSFAIVGSNSYCLFFCKGKIADNIEQQDHSCCVAIPDSPQDNAQHNDHRQHDKKCCDQETIKHDIIDNHISSLVRMSVSNFDIPSTSWRYLYQNDNIYTNHNVIRPPRLELPSDDFVILFQQFII